MDVSLFWLANIVYEYLYIWLINPVRLAKVSQLANIVVYSSVAKLACYVKTQMHTVYKRHCPKYSYIYAILVFV